MRTISRKTLEKRLKELEKKALNLKRLKKDYSSTLAEIENINNQYRLYNLPIAIWIEEEIEKYKDKCYDLIENDSKELQVYRKFYRFLNLDIILNRIKDDTMSRELMFLISIHKADIIDTNYIEDTRRRLRLLLNKSRQNKQLVC